MTMLPFELIGWVLSAFLTISFVNFFVNLSQHPDLFSQTKNKEADKPMKQKNKIIS